MRRRSFLQSLGLVVAKPNELEWPCPQCGYGCPFQANYCGDCGHRLRPPVKGGRDSGPVEFELGEATEIAMRMAGQRFRGNAWLRCARLDANTDDQSFPMAIGEKCIIGVGNEVTMNLDFVFTGPGQMEVCDGRKRTAHGGGS